MPDRTGTNSKQTSTAGQHPDGSYAARVRSVYHLGMAGTELAVELPMDLPPATPFGQYFLARCAEDTIAARQTDWHIYARRPLPVISNPTIDPTSGNSVWHLLISPYAAPHSGIEIDPGYRWLHEMAQRATASTTLNLLGPFGRQVDLPGHLRSLVGLAYDAMLPHLLPAVQTILDRGGHATLIWYCSQEPDPQLLARLPIAVEVQTHYWVDRFDEARQTDGPFSQAADFAAPAEAVRWADQIVAALPQPAYQRLADDLRRLRFRLEPGFVQAFVQADIVCGYGACLACAVALPNGGATRACLHGPVFPLESLVA